MTFAQLKRFLIFVRYRAVQLTRKRLPQAEDSPLRQAEDRVIR